MGERQILPRQTKRMEVGDTGENKGFEGFEGFESLKVCRV